jgi:hypothetical protein
MPLSTPKSYSPIVSLFCHYDLTETFSLPAVDSTPMSSPPSSSSFSLPPIPLFPLIVSNDEQLENRLHGLKSNLQRRATFSKAAEELTSLIQHHLEHSNQRMFFESLKLLHEGLTKPGYSPLEAKIALNTAWERKSVFIPSVRRALNSWKLQADQLSSSFSSSSGSNSSFSPISSGRTLAPLVLFVKPS